MDHIQSIRYGVGGGSYETKLGWWHMCSTQPEFKGNKFIYEMILKFYYSGQQICCLLISPHPHSLQASFINGASEPSLLLLLLHLSFAYIFHFLIDISGIFMYTSTFTRSDHRASHPPTAAGAENVRTNVRSLGNKSWMCARLMNYTWEYEFSSSFFMMFY